MNCMWCENNQIKEAKKDCYWILPDGLSSVQILQVPALSCKNCGLYLTDEMNHEIDFALYTRNLPTRKKEILYEELINAPYKATF
ncbi:hypothetical protein BKP45_13860 [Anaerobacillus alkalidiazotrophicus]|uniref:YokU family protein n=2 Tax=Anaerobacillus alkalidiazotrophicus TaxID=472963 RepID=A0A1S2M3B0_9BACI|nr:hypothetical protein BKP45_13860 [Anaerobacillus alkalidiazotrophicus]